MMKQCLALAAALVLAMPLPSVVVHVEGQVVFQREPVLRSRYQPVIEAGASTRWHFSTFSLPPFIDNRVLAAQELDEDAEEFFAVDGGAPVSGGFYRFGEDFAVDLSLADGTWMDMPDGGRVWRLALHSRSALSLNVLFEEFELPVDSELYVRSLLTLEGGDGQEPEIMGPFTHHNNKAHGKFATAPLAGNTLLLEYYAPIEVTAEPKLRISTLVHGYKEAGTVSSRYNKRGRSGMCNVNVACADGDAWRDQIRSVGMLLTRSGTGYCSGGMLNNGKADGRPLFLTAFHCAGTGDHSNDMVLFNFQRNECDDSSALPDTKQVAHGMVRLAAKHSSDYALFEVQEAIPLDYNVYLAGWSANASAATTTPVGIHHPSADVKKITFANVDAQDSCWGGNCLVAGRTGEFDHWKVPRWAKGTTEPGSSGSPLFDAATKRVVGQLHGGSAACTNKDGYDLYGKLSSSFADSELVAVLDPEASGIVSMDGADLGALIIRQ